MSRAPVVLCVAGEASGDALLAPVVRALRAGATHRPPVECVGTGGDASAAAGLKLYAHVLDFAAHGLVEALPALPGVLAVGRRLWRALDDVDAVLLVDTPELNIRLLRAARARGKPVYWLAPPQTWAWRPGRLGDVRTASRVGCLFPFEAEFHRAHGVLATCVGHPLAAGPPPTPPRDPRALALLPGSRAATAVRLLAPSLVAARALIEAGRIDRVVVGRAPTLARAPLMTAVLAAGLRPERVSFVEGADAALHEAAVAVAGAGTVTLACALAGRPTLVLGALHPVSAAVARRLVDVPHLALPNLVLGRRALPELWQEEVEPARIAAALDQLFTSGAASEAVAVAARLRVELDPGPAGFGPPVADEVAALLSAQRGAIVSAGRSGLSSAPPGPPENAVDTPQKPLIVIPTYNERENLPPLLDRVFEVVPDVHVLVVDDNSPDGTGALADERAARDPRVQVLHRAGKEGLGKAYLAGFKWALERDYTHIFEMDADFSHDPATLPRFLEAARRADLVLGSRWVEGGGTVGWPMRRQLLSKGGSLYARSVLGVDVRDLTGGFKCFHRRVLQAIELDTVQTRGYGFQIELTYRALRHGFKVEEIPIRFADRVAGQSKMTFKIMSEAFTMVWKLRLGT